MRRWNKQTIEEQLKLHKKQNKDDRYNYMSEQFNALWYCWELEKYTIEKDKEIERLNNIIDELEKELKDWENLDLDNLLVVIRNIDKKLKSLKEGK